MGRRLSIVSTAIVTAILTSAFWVFAFNISSSDNGGSAADGRVSGKGDEAAVRPANGGTSVSVAEGVIVGPSGLAIPVAGVKPEQLVDTYTAARAGGSGRHDAIDIMAPDGVPVLAAAPGTVEKLFNSARGGVTVYVRSPDRKWSYYYAHLQQYAPGLAEAQRVVRGQRLGLVGHTGSASPDGPHLHFAINAMNPNEKWWQGVPVNPYPLLAGKESRG